MVAEHVERAEDPKAALAAIRVVGGDLFAPYLLGAAVFHPQDAAVVAQSFAVFPPPVSTPPSPPEGAAEPWLVAWRDWATAVLLARCAGPVDPVGTDATGGGLLAPRPSGAPALSDPVRGPATYTGSDRDDTGTGTSTSTGTGTASDADTDWQHWSVRMGQLSPLALPGLEGPVHDAARAAPLALARGATRAVLRRDFTTAARIVRWLALLSAQGVPVPLDPAPLVEHLRLHGGGPRLALDVAIAARILATETS